MTPSLIDLHNSTAVPSWKRRLLSLSRRVFHWPPTPGSLEDKLLAVKTLGQDRGLKNFIETGTFMGDMVEAQRSNFSTLISIELSDQLYQLATKRFAPYGHIKLLNGDSGDMLTQAIAMIDGPALFWLDAHYSKGITARGDLETPILKELIAITARQETKDVILIDDARNFSIGLGYPRLSRIRRFVESHWPSRSFTVENDVIRIVPSN